MSYNIWCNMSCFRGSRSLCLLVASRNDGHQLKFFSLVCAIHKSNGSSSQRWIQRQMRDPYVKLALEENYRCRSAYKLLQIDDKFGILQPGFNVIDCGAAPGSWTQVAVERVNSSGTDPVNGQGFVVGIDLQDVSPIEGAIILSSCDFTKKETQDKVMNIMKGRKANVILSDMAPSATGIKAHNHQVILQLCFSVLRFSLGVLHNYGTLLCKLWMGGDQKRLENAMKAVFDKVHIVKPEASRNESAEIFMLAQGFHGPKYG